MPDLKTYLSLCTEYYDLDKPRASADALQFYMDYAQRAHGPILEPMCGTGRFLIPLLEAGFDIEGFDASPHMLQALHAKCAHLGISARAWQQFLQDLDTQKQYALIFIPTSSFSLITDLEDVKLCLKRIYQHLRSDGVFVFEVETPRAVPIQLGMWNGSIKHRADGSMLVGSFLPLPPLADVGTTIARYELVNQSVLVKTEFEYYQLRLYTVHSMLPLLKEAGFTSVRALKLYDTHTPPAQHDGSIVFECVK